MFKSGAIRLYLAECHDPDHVLLSVRIHENVEVFWGYGLFPNEVGDFVKKPMKECTGREMMEEVLHFLAFESDMDEILAGCVVIPSMLFYTMAQFVKRNSGDRPEVIPKNATNFLPSWDSLWKFPKMSCLRWNIRCIVRSFRVQALRY
ncbi:hypothetical protein HDU98_005212 [Podochytrium sp. JEL0797]|nr:hypothetical protein HDU98_005212 [Podochytrium sp. JEL0797]